MTIKKFLLKFWEEEVAQDLDELHLLQLPEKSNGVKVASVPRWHSWNQARPAAHEGAIK